MFDVVHVDGLHTELQVLADLKNAESKLRDGGVIIVDNFRHAWFPGITSALYQFLMAEDFRIFMVSPNKAYLARPERARELWAQFKNTRDSLKISRLHENWNEFAARGSYSQESDVLGQPVLIASSVPSPRLVIRFLYKVPRYVRLVFSK